MRDRKRKESLAPYLIHTVPPAVFATHQYCTVLVQRLDFEIPYLVSPRTHLCVPAPVHMVRYSQIGTGAERDRIQYGTVHCARVHLQGGRRRERGQKSTVLWVRSWGDGEGGGKRKEKKEWVGVCANSAGKKVLGFAFSGMSLAPVWCARLLVGFDPILQCL